MNQRIKLDDNYQISKTEHWGETQYLRLDAPMTQSRKKITGRDWLVIQVIPWYKSPYQLFPFFVYTFSDRSNCEEKNCLIKWCETFTNSPPQTPFDLPHVTDMQLIVLYIGATTTHPDMIFTA